MVRGDRGWEGRGGAGGRVVYWGLLLSVAREGRDSVVLAWKSWGNEGREEESGVVVGGRGRGQGGRGRVAAGSPSSATLSCDFFPHMCWEWIGLCRVRLASSKGGERGLISDGPPKTRPHVYTHTFHSSSTATKIEEAGGSIPSFSS